MLCSEGSGQSEAFSEDEAQAGQPCWSRTGGSAVAREMGSDVAGSGKEQEKRCW